MLKKLIVIATLVATPAFADSQNQSGVGNTQQQGNHNNINSGNTNVGAINNNNRNTNRNTNTNNNHQGQAQGQFQGQAIEGSGNSANSYISKQAASSATSAALVAADDTCMGSSSAGAQGMGFGISAGSTWQDSDCVRRKDSRELHNMGYKKAALKLMCQNDNVAKAMEDAGTPCRDTVVADLAPSSGEAKKSDYDFLNRNRH